MKDPVIIAIISAAAVIIVLTIIGRLWRSRREAVHDSRRRAELRKQRGFLQMQEREVKRLAGRIIATSSTAAIAGFIIVRQIEAVFTDGHSTPGKAVAALKATAAEKGANAVINLTTARPPTGKCLAHGDAVVVRPDEDAPEPFVSDAAPPADSPTRPDPSL